MSNDTDKYLNIFDLSYFLNTKDGKRFSRARTLFDGLEIAQNISVAKVTAHDFDIVEKYLCSDDDDKKLLSELALSCFTLGAIVAEMNPELAARIVSERNTKAVNTRHDQPGGSRDKQQQIRDIWATGKYSNRDICAEQEFSALNMSFSSARRALRNTPDPIKKS